MAREGRVTLTASKPRCRMARTRGRSRGSSASAASAGVSGHGQRARAAGRCAASQLRARGSRPAHPRQRRGCRDSPLPRPLNRAYPGDDITIVGHSLGGLIAYDVANYSVSIGAAPHIGAVVAIDSPLHGVSANAALLGLFACGAGTALNQLNAMFDDAATPTYLQKMYASAHLVGARVGVVANQADCLYFWGMCANGFGRDTRGTEFAPADWSLAPSVGDPLTETIEQSHGAVLYDPGVMGEVAAFIGRQGQ